MPGQSTHTKHRFGIGDFTIVISSAGVSISAAPSDPLTNNAHAFRLITEVHVWDRQQGDAQYLAGVPGQLV